VAGEAPDNSRKIPVGKSEVVEAKENGMTRAHAHIHATFIATFTPTRDG